MKKFYVLSLAVALFSMLQGAQLRVGDEYYAMAEKSMQFKKCNAYATYSETSGFTIVFTGDSVVSGGIAANVDNGGSLKIVLEYGSNVTVVKGNTRNEGIVASFSDLTISGLGTLNVMSGGIYAAGGMKLIGTSVNVINEQGGSSALRTYMSAPIEIEASFVSIVGFGTLIDAGGITMTGSMINLVQGYSAKDSRDAAVEAWFGSNRISIVGCVVALLANDEDSMGFNCPGNILIGDSCVVVRSRQSCFRSWYRADFQNSRVLAVSDDHSAIRGYYSSGTPAKLVNKNDCVAFFGDGKYVLGSGKSSPAISSGKVEIDDGKLEVSAPSSAGAWCWDFEMKDGKLEMVDEVDFKNCYEEILTQAAIEAVVAKSGVFGEWTGMHTTMLASMIEKLAMSVSGVPSGSADAAMYANTFVQSGGSIKQGTAKTGCMVTRMGSYSESVDAIATPAFVGGEFNGLFQTSGYKDGVKYEYYDIHPTNALGQALTHVTYSPYWEYRGTPSNADLIPYTKTGWSGPLVLAKSATDYVGTSNFSIDDEVYFHFAVLNRGADLASPFNVSLYLDGTHVVSVKCDALKNNYFSYWTGGKMGAVDPGTHTLSMVVDASNAVLETDEDNNVHTIEFKVIDDRVKIVLDSQGGLVLADQMLIKRGNAVGALPTPTRAKYKFDGWYTAPTGGTKVTASTKVTADVTYYAHWTYDGKVAVSVALGDGCDGMGMVSGGGTVAPGKSVTVKATARSAKKATKTVAAQTATVFAGWYLDAACTVKATGSWQSPTYAYVAGEDDIKLYAKFIEQAVDVAAVSFEMPDELTTGVTAVNTTVDVSGCSSLPTVKVTGLPTGLKFAAKDILKKGSKTEVEYAANTIYGTPTKSGVYAIVVAVTTAGMKTASYSQTVVVRKADEKVVKTNVALVDANGVLVSADVVPGKASGSGVYAIGKKVTLKATVNKGYVFMGWRIGGVIVDRNASYGFSMPDADRDVTALFITAAEDKANIFAGVGGLSLDPWVSNQETHAYKTNVWAGVYLEWPVVVKALSATTVKVTGLPSGLKFASKDVVDAKTKRVMVPANTIYGAPCAVSKQGKASAIKITVTTAGKSTSTFEIDATVLSLPAWAQGTYAGGWASDGDVTSGGQVTLTSSAAGKISGKALGDGVTYTLAAPYYSEVLYLSGGDDSVITNFCADVTASWTVKVGSRSVKTNETFGVWVRDEGIGGIATTLDWFYAYKNDWKAEPWKTITKALEQETRSGTVVQYYVRSDGKLVDGNEGAHALDDEYVAVVTLKFAANGVVKETGEFVSGYDAKKGKYVTVKASGSTVAVPTNENDGIIFVYLTPKGLPPYGHVVKWGELFE